MLNVFNIDPYSQGVTHLYAEYAVPPGLLLASYNLHILRKHISIYFAFRIPTIYSTGCENLKFNDNNAQPISSDTHPLPPKMKKAMYVQTCNYCCRGKAISIKICVYSLSYPACKAHVPYYIVTCDQSGSTILNATLSHKGRDIRDKSYGT